MAKRSSAGSRNESIKLAHVARFVLAPCIEEELWAIWEYIAGDNPEAATRVIEAAGRTFRRLAENPGLGRKYPFGDRRLKDVRCLPVEDFENYLVFYRGIPGGIEVIHVYHGARDIDSLFEFD
jgi:toxin ParE1/3/4